MPQLTIRIRNALERHDRWIERLYWKAILFESALWIAGYGAGSYLILGRIDISYLLALTLGFPTLLVIYRARTSLTVGKVLYTSAGAALGILLGSIGVLVALAIGIDVSFGTLMVSYTSALPGAWLGHRWGKKRGFLMPGSSKMGNH